MILNSQQRDSGGIGGNIWRCRKKYHVTSVRRHLQVGVAFPSTNRPRVGSRSPVAQSVTSRLLRILNWRGTPSFTPERDLTSAHNATFHVTGLTPSNCIPRSTLGKNFTNAINATIRLIILPASKGTSRNTLGKICIIAINVNNSCRCAKFLHYNFQTPSDIACLSRCIVTLVECLRFSQMWVFTCAFKCLLEQMQSHNSCMRATFWNVSYHMSPQIACLNRYKVTLVA